MWSTVIWDCQSGALLSHVDASGGSWQRGRIAEQSHTFPLPALDLSRAEAHNLFGKDRPRDRVLSVLWNNAPVYHGLIIDSKYNRDKGTLEVIHNDVRELAAFRWLYGIGASSQTFNWSGLSLRGLATRIARIIYTDPISPAWPLPVSIPADEPGGHEMTVYGYEFRTGEDLLTDLEETDGGPDLDFRPTMFGNNFGWEFRAGAPYLSGPTYEFHLQAAESPLTDIVVHTIGQEKVTGVHGIGRGSEWDMVRGGAAAPVSAGLARDTKLTLKEAGLSEVNSRSAGYLASRLNTYEQWTFNVRIDETGIEDPSALRLGSIIWIHSSGDLWIPDGWTQHRVIGFGASLDKPHTLNVTVERA